MEELEILIKAIAGLPNMAIWALVVFYGYKVAVIGSVYGVIRFVASSVLAAYKYRHEAERLKREQPKQVPVEVTLDGVVLGDKEALLGQLRRIASIAEHDRLKPGVQFFTPSVAWLRAAVDEKLAKEPAK